jgi:amidohydrolase
MPPQKDAPSAGAAPDPAAAEVLAAAREALAWMVEIRRDLHRHPELGLEEHRTAGRVQAVLDELGIEHRDGLAETGVLGTIRGGRSGSGGGSGDGGDGPVVALRADLDALPLQEANEVPYRSTVPGRMHACGHDVLTTVLLGAARLLAARRDRLAGTVKLIFQPAEETVGGARMLIDEGVLDDPPVDAVFGLHVDPTMEVGTVGVRYGQRNASSDGLRVVVHGRSCHGAYPADGVDAVVAAAHVVAAMQAVVARNVDPRQSAVVTFGSVHGGTQGNIVASQVELVGTIRTLDPEVRETVLRRVRETAEGVAAGLGARAEVEIRPDYVALINHDPMVDLVRATAGRLLGEPAVRLVPQPSMGVEDFAFYVARVPGAFYSLGAGNREAGIVHPLHSERFDVDESCLAVGAALQTLNALAVLDG